MDPAELSLVAPGPPPAARPAGGRPARTGPRRTAAVLAAAVALLSLLQLFAGSAVGLADNGDGARLMCKAGLAPVRATPFASPQWDYAPAGRSLCAAGRMFHYDTSWSWVLRPTAWAYSRLAGEGHVDLRVLGVVDSLLLGALVGALFLAWPGATRDRLLVSAGVALVALDIRFLAYFNSPLSEPAGLLGLLAVLAAAVRLAAARQVRAGHLAALAAAAGFVALDKNQLTPVVLLVVPLLLWRGSAYRPGAAAAGWSSRLVGALLSVALLAGGAMYVGSTGKGFTDGNTWDLWFGAVLAESPHPAADLREVGMDPALARYAGTTAWNGAGWFDPAFLSGRSHLTRGTVLLFLARHPDRVAVLGRHAVRAATVTRPPGLANVHRPGATAADPGLPAVTARPDPAELLLRALRPLAWPVLPLLWLLTAGCGVRLLRRPDPGRRALGAALYVLGGGALLMCLAALGDGYYELVKHEVYAAYLTALLLGVAAAVGVSAAVSAGWPAGAADRVRRRRATARPMSIAGFSIRR